MSKEITTLDEAGLKLIAHFEGLKLHPYLDQAKIPTIGIGMTYYPETGKKVTMHDKPLASVAEAYRQFQLMSKSYALGVYSVTRDDINQNQFNALFCLCYNIGVAGFKASTLLKLVNKHIIGEPLKDEWARWNKAGGKVMPDLVKRRADEFKIYMS